QPRSQKLLTQSGKLLSARWRILMRVKHVSRSHMNAGTKACVAYITGRTISGRSSSHVYDYSRSTFVNISGNVGRSVSIYDYERGCHIAGSGGRHMSLYDYGVSGHVTLNISGNGFTGFDYDTSSHFQGNVNGNAVTLYDYSTGTWHNYTL